MVYKAMVADDEDIIRRGIIKLLKKYDQIEVAAEAEDGEIAYDLAGKIPLDILFVDINMPFLNGLEFIGKMKEIRPDAVVIVVTGYDDFEYIRQSLRLGVNDYLLKPLMEDSFDKALRKALELIEEKGERKRRQSHIQRLFEDNKPAFIMDTMEKWIKGQYSYKKFMERINCLSIDLPKPYIITMIYLEPSDDRETNDLWKEDLLYYAVENIGREVFQEISEVYSFQDDGGRLVLISKNTDKDHLDRLNRTYYTAVSQYIPVKMVLLQESGNDYDEFLEKYSTLNENIKEIIQCPGVIKIVKQFIEKNYNKNDFSLSDAADYMNLSPEHLSRIFKKETGITFVDYLTRIRIRRSMELLRKNDMKIYEIAERAGYSSQHYFSSVFKKETGMSPIDYRKKIIAK